MRCTECKYIFNLQKLNVYIFRWIYMRLITFYSMYIGIENDMKCLPTKIMNDFK